MPRQSSANLIALHQVAQAQAGLLTAAQLAVLGVSPATISYRARPGGMWSRILPGVHLLSPATPDALQRDVAALLYCGRGAVLTGISALRQHGLAFAPPSSEHADYVQVLIPHTYKRASTAFVRVERTRRMPQPTMSETNPALPLAPAARAIVDVTRHMRDRNEVVTLAADAVSRDFVSVRDLELELAKAARQGSAHLRRALEHADAGVWSSPEADLRPLIRMAGLPEPLWNHRLFASNGRVIAIPDAWLDDVALALEVDSQRFHASGADWDRTVRRQAAYAREGVLCLPLTPRQIAQNPHGVVVALREAYAAAAARPRPNVRIGPPVIRDPSGRPSIFWGG